MLARSLAVVLAGAVLLGCTGNIDSGGGTGEPGPGAGGSGAGAGGTGVGAGGTGTPGTGGTGGSIAPPSTCTSDVPAPVRIWRLTPAQYNNSLDVLVGDKTQPGKKFLFGANAASFLNDDAADVRRPAAEGYRDAAAAAAKNLVATRLAMVLPCMPPDPASESCVQKFIADFGRRAYRAPVDPESQGWLLDVYKVGKVQSALRGVEMVVEAMLQAPEFVYRYEIGKPTTGALTELTQHELASYLSYTLWDAPPDATLSMLADGGRLVGPAIAAEARRLLGDARARPVVGDFVVQMLGLDTLGHLTKDATVFKNWKDTFGAAMAAEVSAFAEHVVFDGGGALATLFSANYSMVNADLAGLYKVTGVTGTAPVKTVLNPMERSGLLTQVGFLSAFAKSNATDPIARGREVRQRLLCQKLVDPPANVNAVPPPPNPNLTTRQRYDMHRSNPTCASCHTLIDPIGLGFENYDGIGQFRAKEGTLAIDNGGEVLGVDPADAASGKFTGVLELSRKMSTSAHVRDCMATSYFRLAQGRVEGAGDTCALGGLKQKFAAAGGNVLALIEDAVSGEFARYRTK